MKARRPLPAATGMFVRILGLLAVLLVAWPDLPAHAADAPAAAAPTGADHDEAAQRLRRADQIAIDWPQTDADGALAAVL